MKLVVDRDLCQGHSICLLIAPQMFTLDEDGLAVVLADPVDEASRMAAVDAVNACPVRAITLVEG
jgi:ferredoxin